MTEIDTLTYGKRNMYTYSSCHMLRESIEEFLITDTALSILSTVIKLSIAIEILIKETLEKIDPLLIDAKGFDGGSWKRIKSQLSISRVQKRNHILTSLRKTHSESKTHADKTIGFGLLLEVFPYFFRISKLTMKDLNTLKDYRNGLFHWKAERENFFALSALVMRLFFWSIKFIKQHPVKERPPLRIPDIGYNKKLTNLQSELKKSRNRFNVLRRIYRCHHGLNSYQRIAKALIDYKLSPAFKRTSLSCEVCGNEMYVGYSTSKALRNSKVIQTDFGLWCAICDFYLHENEYRAIKSTEAPHLREMYAQLKA